MENKPKYDKVKYNNEFIKNNYDSLRIVTPKGNKGIIQAYCKENGLSVNGLVNQLLKEYFEKQGIQIISK